MSFFAHSRFACMDAREDKTFVIKGTGADILMNIGPGLFNSRIWIKTRRLRAAEKFMKVGCLTFRSSGRSETAAHFLMSHSLRYLPQS